MTKASKISATIILADGTEHTAIVPRRYWKSHLMHQLPYGSSFQGCTFKING